MEPKPAPKNALHPKLLHGLEKVFKGQEPKNGPEQALFVPQTATAAPDRIYFDLMTLLTAAQFVGQADQIEKNFLDCAEKMAALSDVESQSLNAFALRRPALSPDPACYRINSVIHSASIGRELGFAGEALVQLAAFALQAPCVFQNKNRYHAFLDSSALIRRIQSWKLRELNAEKESAPGRAWSPAQMAAWSGPSIRPYSPLSDERTRQFQRIVSVAQTFEALVHVLNQDSWFLPGEAVRFMAFLGRDLLDAKCCRALVIALTFFPVGTMVALSNGQVGVVIAVDSRRPSSPMVEIVEDMKDSWADRKIVDLDLKNHLSIRREIKPS